MFNQEFKSLVQEGYQFSGFLEELKQLLESPENNLTRIREILEDGIEDINLEEELMDDGDRLIFNAKLKLKRQRERIYSDFMESIIENNLV